MASSKFLVEVELISVTRATDIVNFSLISVLYRRTEERGEAVKEHLYFTLNARIVKRKRIFKSVLSLTRLIRELSAELSRAERIYQICKDGAYR
jgi:hypothetical protein